MRASLIPRLRCPASGGPLRLEGAGGDWIEEGALVSEGGRRYSIHRGMPHLYVEEDPRWQPKAREAEGWVRLHKDVGTYDQTGVEIDFQLPHFPEQPWIDIARQFAFALELIGPQPGMWALDVGAGKGWAAKHLALLGCNAVAIEVNPDDQAGLGRAGALMERAGTRFDAVIGDSENLPFAEASFDVVFAAAALHHTSDLGLLLENIGRVLRPGGRLVAMNEPCIADDASDEARQAAVATELGYGINENHPRLDEYRAALGRAALRERGLFAWQAYSTSAEERAAWSAELGVPPPEAFEPRPRPLDRIARWLGGRGPALQGAIPPQPWMDHLLRRRGGGVILVAER